MNEALVTVITWLFFIAGMAGALIPILPSLPLIVGGILFYGYFHAWQGLSLQFWAVTATLAALGWLLELKAGTALLRKRQASKSTSRAALFGILFGPIVLGPIGIIAGPLALAVLAELIQGKPFGTALNTGLRALGGVFLAALVKLGSIWAIIFWFWRSI